MGAMTWLLHNPVAALPSEYLLLFYSVAVGAVILACRGSVRAADWTRTMEPPGIPDRIDPYEIAYLRGGETEVTRIAIRSLLQRGLLQIIQSRDRNVPGLTIRKEVDRGRKPEPDELAPIEASIMKWNGFPATDRQIYQPDDTPFKSVSTLFWHGATGRHSLQPGGVPALIGSACDRYQDTLAANLLLAPPEMRQRGCSLLWLGSALILGLGGWLVAVALVKGEPLVAIILFPMALFGAMALAPACLAFPRISSRGGAYLDQLELAYDRMRNKSHGGSAFADRLLLDAIFGEVSAADTPFNDLWNSLILNDVVIAPGEAAPKG
jgi:hypothetical protein